MFARSAEKWIVRHQQLGSEPSRQLLQGAGTRNSRKGFNAGFPPVMAKTRLVNNPIQQLDAHCRTIAQAIRQVSFAAYRVEAGLIGTQHFPPLLERVDEIIVNQNDFYGVYSEQELVGVIELEGEDVVQINRMVVHPRFFRRGIATRLVRHAKALNKTLTVLTATLNEPALNFYRTMGFRVEHTFLLDQNIEVSMLECPADQATADYA